jgi:hypothetical protein
LSGIDVISVDFSSVWTSALSVCSSCASDATVIDSLSAPTSSVKSTRAICPIDTGTLVRTVSRKPVSATLTSYGPARTLVSV